MLVINLIQKYWSHYRDWNVLAFNFVMLNFLMMKADDNNNSILAFTIVPNQRFQLPCVCLSRWVLTKVFQLPNPWLVYMKGSIHLLPIWLVPASLQMQPAAEQMHPGACHPPPPGTTSQLGISVNRNLFPAQQIRWMQATNVTQQQGIETF